MVGERVETSNEKAEKEEQEEEEESEEEESEEEEEDEEDKKIISALPDEDGTAAKLILLTSLNHFAFSWPLLR